MRRKVSLLLLLLLTVPVMGQKITALTEETAPKGTDVTIISHDADTATPLSRKITLNTLSPQVNVKYYGATGDGVTDDTAAVQAAVDACAAAGGGVVFLPEGDYHATVTSNSGTVQFKGSGASNTFWEAYGAGGYALTMDWSGSSPQRVEAIRFNGAARTKGGIYRLKTTTGGIACLDLVDCRFQDCDKAFYDYGTFWWKASMCYFQDNNYDFYIKGLPGVMQAASAVIDHCYSNGSRIASIRLLDALWEFRVIGGIIEDSYGFVITADTQSNGYPIVMDGVHLEGNVTTDSVLLDGIATTPYSLSFKACRQVVVKNMEVNDVNLSEGSVLLLEGCTMDADIWNLNTDAGTTNSLIARNCMPYSSQTIGNTLNDVYCEGRKLTSSFSYMQNAPGPLTGDLRWDKTNKLSGGSMANDFTPTAVGGNTVAFSGAYDSPIHGRCMTVAFASANQAVGDGVQLWANYTVTINKWYVWSMDLKSVTNEGYLSAAFRGTGTTMRSVNMRVYPDRWTRYWGVTRHTSGTTGTAHARIWNQHATANPTFLIANMQLVEFDDADQAEKFINEAAYVPDASMPIVAPTFFHSGVTAGITATNPGVQGNNPITTQITEVSVVGVASDAVTAPAAVAGREFTVINNGANTLEIWPASGDNLGAGVDTAVTLASGTQVTYAAYDATSWEQLGSAANAGASFQFTDENASPTVAGMFKYDNTVAGFDDGLMAWYDDDAIRYVVDLTAAVLPGDAQDDYVVAYDKDTDQFYMKADETGAGGGDPVLVDTTAIADAAGVDLTSGLAIDITLNAGVSPDTATIAFDPTEITGGTTWDDGGEASVTWTWNLSAGDPQMIFGNAAISLLATTTHLGVDNTIGSMEVHDLGTIKFWDDGDDTSVVLGPVADGTTVLGVTGTINATGLQVGGAAVYYAGGTDVADADVADNITASSYLLLAGGTVSGTITDNDDLVLGLDENNDGSNKLSIINGLDGEVASVTEAGVLYTASDIELGAAADTTISRSAAGAVQIEGLQILLSGHALTGDVTATLDTDGSTATTIAAASVEFGMVDNTATLAGDPTLAASEVWFGTTGLIAEGSTADGIETLVTFTDPTVADKTITVPNADGTILLSGHALTGDVTATMDTDGSTAATIADSVTVASWTLTGATLAGILADNDDMVFEVDADSDGTNKYSFTDGASAEVASITEAGALYLASNIELGAAADTTISRSAAGAVQIEGLQVLLSGHTLTGDVTATMDTDGSTATTIADTVTVTGWTLGASVATTPAANDNDTSLATTAWCETTQAYIQAADVPGLETNAAVDSEAEIEAITGAYFGASKVVTAGYLWVADGTDFESVPMSGDGSIASGGALTIANDSHTHVSANISDTHAGTAITADLEEEVTEGSLANSTIVSDDIKDATIAGADLAAAIAITSTGAQDYSGASDFKVPVGANPTTNAAGEVAVDSSAAAGGGLRVYGDGTVAGYTLPAYQTKSFVILSPTAASDAPFWRVPYAITMRAIHVQVTGGTSVTGGLDEYNSAGAAIVAAVDADIVANAGASTDDDGGLTNASIAAGNYLYWHTTSVDGTITSMTISFEYTADQS